MSVFSDRLIECCKALKINQEKLGDAIGVSRYTVSFWENGTRAPSITELIQISRLLGVSCAYLLGEADKPAALEPEKAPIKEDRPQTVTGLALDRLAKDIGAVDPDIIPELLNLRLTRGEAVVLAGLLRSAILEPRKKRADAE